MLDADGVLVRAWPSIPTTHRMLAIGGSSYPGNLAVGGRVLYSPIDGSL